MAGIKDMVVGKKYLAGDSYGYDKVECIAINPKETPEGCYGVKVHCLDSGKEELFYEMPAPNTSVFALFRRDIFLFRVEEFE